MAEAPKAPPVQLNEGSKQNQGRRSVRVFDLLEGAIRRSTYILLALGAFAASLKLLCDVIAALFAR